MVGINVNNEWGYEFSNPTACTFLFKIITIGVK